MSNLGPLAPLVGVWESEQGIDVAPSDDRGVAESPFRERTTFEDLGVLVDNHEQLLYGLRYQTMAWRIGGEKPFHEESGFWMWDAAAKQVMRCFTIPRGVALIAGGTVQDDAREFHLSAASDSSVYGITQNIFLEKEFKTLRFDMKLEISPDGKSISYFEDTHLQMKGREEVFHHTDQNTLKKR